jgi:hypothetical protein
MWHAGRPAAEQCEGCTFYNGQIGELSSLHSRDVTYATFCQGPYQESARYRDFMGWDMPWYSADASVDTLLAGRQIGLFHLVCYLRDGDRVFETYRTTRRGAEAMDYSYALMDLTVYGRQEPWEDSPPGWPQQCSNTRTNGGPPAWPPVAMEERRVDRESQSRSSRVERRLSPGCRRFDLVAGGPGATPSFVASPARTTSSRCIHMRERNK